MADARKTSEKAAVTPPDPTSKRTIQMKMFATNTEKAKVALAFEETPNDLSTHQIAVGQIVGRIFEVTESLFEVNGEEQSKLTAQGEFEAIVFRTGEVMEAPGADLPRYYLESVKGALARNNGAAVLIGGEVVLVATGKSIPVAYEFRNLIPREADNPLNKLKAAIQSKGRLRLPPPTGEASVMLADDTREEAAKEGADA